MPPEISSKCLADCQSLEHYMNRYSGLLGQQAADRTEPLHVPGRDTLPELDTLRDPLPAQHHLIAGSVQLLQRDRFVGVVGQMGTGKTFIGAAIAHTHADGKPYRACVFCPPHLAGKWKRELLLTVPDARVHILRSYRDVCAMDRNQRPQGAEWFIVSQSTAKLGTTWEAKYVTHKRPIGVAHCPRCGQVIYQRSGDGKGEVPINPKDLSKRRHKCEHCDEPLYAYTSKYDKWPVAHYVNRRLRGHFDYLVVDEVHEEKGDKTAQANAMGAMAAASKRVIAMTGTLLGGYADHLRTLLFRLCPRTLVEEGFAWNERTAFNERYGRIETVVHEREEAGPDNRQSRGSSRSTRKSVKPGVMPSLFGRLAGNFVFLSLDEVASDLPGRSECIVPIALDEEQEDAYRHVERKLEQVMKEMVRRNDRRMLGAMLNTLLGYPDYPYGWGEVGYYDRPEGPSAAEQVFVPVVEPPDLGDKTVRPKEEALIETVLAEQSEGRQCWVFVQMTGKRDCVARLQGLLEAEGLNVKVLRPSVPTRKREEWIAEHAADADVVISHPKLVETGLDLFDKDGAYNFVSLLFYQTGYNLFTLRQAAARSHRIGQTEACKVFYFYYEDTMQSRAMSLMGKKLSAAEAIEGKFSEEGLAAMSGDEGSVELELAKSLVDKLDDSVTARTWERVSDRGPLASTPSPLAKPRRKGTVVDKQDLFDNPAGVSARSQLAFAFGEPDAQDDEIETTETQLLEV